MTIDTNTTPATEPASAPATDTAATPTPATETSTTAAPAVEAKKPTEAEIVKGFGAAIAADPEAKPAEKKDEPAPATATEAKPEGEKPKTDDEKAADKAAADVEAEIKTLGLKDKTAERFRELSKRPTVEAVEKQVAPLRERAQKADDWENILRQSTAKPDQLSNALGYLQAINSGDPKSMRSAYDMMTKEVAWLGQQLGIEAPGYDPLKEHADLALKVADGDMTREVALELAQHRTASKRGGEHQARTAQAEREERERQQAFDKGIADLGALGANLKSTDAEYAKKLPLLAPHLAWARANLTPDKWVAYVEHQYSQLKVAPTPAAPPPVGSVPLRPTGSATGQVAKPKDALDAFKMGMQGASAG
jgi:hypothetical protein